jgi:hypothetical protein
MKTYRPLLKFGIFTALLLGLGALTYRVAITQNGGPRYFPETGHTLEGEFLDFYQRVSDPELVYGYPITGQMESRDGLLVQYFQRARFELHPEAPEGQRIQLTPLGERMYQFVVPFDLQKNPAICRRFQNGFDVCYSFLEFFDRNGGIAQFGLPISEVEERGSRYVQYFEYARLEWHPDGVGVDLTQEVQLSFLGRQYFELIGEDPAWLQPAQGNFIQQIITLRTHAFPIQAVITTDQTQTLFVIVQDQNLSPIQGMDITLKITYPDKVTNTITLGTTNVNGFTSGEIPVPSRGGVGMVNIDVTATAPGLEAYTRTSFRVAP